MRGEEYIVYERNIVAILILEASKPLNEALR